MQTKFYWHHVFKSLSKSLLCVQDNQNAVCVYAFLEQFSYRQEKRLASWHWYNTYNPVISVELTELAERVVANNDSVVEIQLDLCIQTTTCSLLGMSDVLFRALQCWITRHGYPMKSQCYVSLQAVEPLPPPLTRCLGVLTNIPIFAFFPWTWNLAHTMLGLFDWLGYSWLMTQLQAPWMEFKLVIILIHTNNSEWRHNVI